MRRREIGIKTSIFASEEAQILQEQLDMGEKAQKGEITMERVFSLFIPRLYRRTDPVAIGNEL